MPLALDLLEKARQKREAVSKSRVIDTEKQKRSNKPAGASRKASVSKIARVAQPASPKAQPKNSALQEMMRSQLETAKKKHEADRPVPGVVKEKEEETKPSGSAPGLRRVAIARKIAIPARTFIHEQAIEEEVKAIAVDEDEDVETEGEDLKEEEQEEEQEKEEVINELREPVRRVSVHEEAIAVDEEVESEEEEQEILDEEPAADSHEFSIRNMFSLPFEVISSGFRSISQAVFGASERRKHKNIRKDEIKTLDDFRRLKQILESAPVEKRKKILNKFAEFGAVFYLIAKDHPKTIEKIVPILKDLDHLIAGEMK